MSSPAGPYTSPVPHQPAPARVGRAVTALVLGVLAILGCWVPVLNVGSIVLAIIGIVLAALTLRAAHVGRVGVQGMAIAGLTLSVLAVIGAVLINVLFGLAVNTANKDGTRGQTAAPSTAAPDGPAPDPSAPDTPAPDAPPFPGYTFDDVVGGAGEALAVGDTTVTTTALATRTDALGTALLCSTVTYVNNGADPDTFNLFDWSLQDPQGAARTVTPSTLTSTAPPAGR